MANGKYCIQNAGNAGNKFWSVNGATIEQSSSNKMTPEQFIFDLEPINGAKEQSFIDDESAVYYIKCGNDYLTNNGTAPTFISTDSPDKKCEWKLTKDPKGMNYFKLTSNADGRYVNEYGKFGQNKYLASWNTYLILTMDGKYSIQTTQNSGTHFWNREGNGIIQDNSLSRSTSYVFEIIKK